MPKKALGKTYYVLSDTTYQPGKSLVLGRILDSPLRPDNPLNRGTIPDYDETEDGLEKVTKFKQKVNLADESGGKFKLLAKVFGGGEAGASASAENNAEKEYFVKKVETVHFNPGNKFVGECFNNEGVQKFLKAHKFRKPIFMITGVKIAYGTTFSSNTTKKGEGAIKATGDATAAGFPAQFGAEGSVSKSKTSDDSWRGSSDFVFAFRVHQIIYEGQQVTGTTLVDGGQLMDAENKSKDYTRKNVAEGEILAVFQRISKKDAEPGIFGLESTTVLDDSDEEEPYAYVMV